MAKWLLAQKRADFNALAARFGIDPVTARVLRNRGLTDEEEIDRFLNGTLEALYEPSLLKDMDRTVALLREAIEKGAEIRVVGDYDVDGICASFILQKGIEAAGGRVDTAIPHRIYDGYGINERLIREAIDDGVKLLITCDNGIAAEKEIRQAKEAGLTVIVTDHHEVPFREAKEAEGERQELLPPADAVVDPKRSACAYPYPNICGAFVALKVVQALLDFSFRDADFLSYIERRLDMPAGAFEGNSGAGRSPETGHTSKAGYTSEAGHVSATGHPSETEMRAGHGEEQPTYTLFAELIGLAALATVCDVMELLDENRVLVRTGLRLLSRTKNTGLTALLTATGLLGKELSAYHAGFILGPCMNASGRLDSAERALSMLNADSPAEAARIAGECKALNDARKELTEHGVEEAVRQIEASDGTDKVLVVFLPDAHESIAGIIAGRLREKYYRPTLVLTRGEEGVKGSGRSIEGYHMYEALHEVSALFAKFGGHAMAAGFSLRREEDVDTLRESLNEACALTDTELTPVLHIDVPMPVSYVTKPLVKELSELSPFGTGNPKPLFAQKDVKILTGRVIGKNRNVGKFTVADESGEKRELVLFRGIEDFAAFLDGRFGEGTFSYLTGQSKPPKGGTKDIPRIHIAYSVSLNEYRGETSVELVLEDYC